MLPSQIPDIRLLQKLQDMGDSSEKRIVKAIEFFDDQQYFYIDTYDTKQNTIFNRARTEKANETHS